MEEEISQSQTLHRAGYEADITSNRPSSNRICRFRFKPWDTHPCTVHAPCPTCPDYILETPKEEPVPTANEVSAQPTSALSTAVFDSPPCNRCKHLRGCKDSESMSRPPFLGMFGFGSYQCGRFEQGVCAYCHKNTSYSSDTCFPELCNNCLVAGNELKAMRAQTFESTQTALSPVETFAFDVDGTIASNPAAYATVMKSLVATGHKVIVLTGALYPPNINREITPRDFRDLVSHAEEHRERQLKQLSTPVLRFTHYSEIHVAIGKSCSEVAHVKAAYCREKDVLMAFDDTDDVCFHIRCESPSTAVCKAFVQ